MTLVGECIDYERALTFFWTRLLHSWLCKFCRYLCLLSHDLWFANKLDIILHSEVSKIPSESWCFYFLLKFRWLSWILYLVQKLDVLSSRVICDTLRRILSFCIRFRLAFLNFHLNSLLFKLCRIRRISSLDVSFNLQLLFKLIFLFLFVSFDCLTPNVLQLTLAERLVQKLEHKHQDIDHNVQKNAQHEEPTCIKLALHLEDPGRETIQRIGCNQDYELIDDLLSAHELFFLWPSIQQILNHVHRRDLVAQDLLQSVSWKQSHS